MQSLNHDVQIQIFMYLYPEEIKSCYNCFSSILNELFSHIGFQIHCKPIVCKETILWMKEKKITFHLFYETCEQNNTKITKCNGLLHSSNDIPSVFDYFTGNRIWHKNGERHRDGDQPALIQSDGTRIWYQHGKIHRDYDLPAIISGDGIKEWYRCGQLYRNNRHLPTILDGRQQQKYSMLYFGMA